MLVGSMTSTQSRSIKQVDCFSSPFPTLILPPLNTIANFKSSGPLMDLGQGVTPFYIPRIYISLLHRTLWSLIKA